MAGGGGNGNVAQAGDFSWNGGGWDGGRGGSGGTFNAGQANSILGNDIMAAYLQGPGAVFGQSLYTGLGQQSQDSMQGMRDAANQNSGALTDALNANSGVIANGGLTSGQQGNMDALNGVNQNYQDIYSRSGQPSLTEQTLMGTAQGNNIGQGNPFLQDIINRSNDQIYANTMASFGGSGGVGSNLQTDQLASSIGNNTTNLLYGDYQNSLDRQMQALGAIEGQRQQGINNQMGALVGQAGVQGQQFGMGQTGQQNLNQAIGQAGALFNNTLLPSQIGLQIGQMQDADAQAQRLAEYEQYQRENDPNFNHIARYLGLLGAQNQGAQPDQPPTMLDWLGLGIQGAGLLL